MQTKTRQRGEAASEVTAAASQTVRSPLHGDGRKSKVLKSEKLSPDEQYRDLFDNTSDLIQSVAPDGRILYTNKAWRNVLGYSEKEIAQLKIWDIISPESMDHCMELFKRVMAGEHVLDIAAVFVAKDGSPIAVEGDSHCRFVEGKPVSTQGFFRDVTKRKQAEEALQESEEKYRDVAERANDGICIIQDGIVKYLNPRLANMWSGTVEEFNDTPFIEHLHPDNLREMADLYKRRIAGEDVPPAYEITLVSKDGSRLYGEVNAGVISYKGKPADLVIIRDITERKQVDEVLRESEQKYRLLAENARDVIWTMDMNLRFTYMSPSVLYLRGYTAEEVMSQSVEEIFTPSSLEVAMKALEEELAIEGMEQNDLTRSRILELEHTCKDGSTVWVEIRVTLLRDQNGRLVGLLGISRDITERKVTEEALRQSEERYRTLFNSKLDGICVMDETMKVLLVNQAAVDIFGFDSIDEALGANPFDFIPVEERERVLAIVKKDMFEHDLRQTNEFRLTNKSGKDIWVSTIGTLTEYQGKLAGLISFRDVTDKKLAEEALRLSEQNFRDSIESSPLGIHVIDKDGKHIYANRAFLNIWGYNTIEEMQAVPRKQRYTPKGYAEHMKIMRKRKQGEDAPLNYEASIVRGDGQVRHLAVSYGELLWNGERQFQAVYQDITERKQAAEQVKKLYSLQTAIRYINEALLKVDDEPALFEQVCHFLAGVEFIKFCWIGLADKESREVKPVAYSGFEDGYLSSLKISLSGSSYSRGPIGTAIKTSQPCTVADIENDPGFPPWREAALKRGYASSLAVPLIYDTEVIGALSIYSGSKGAFGDAEIDFLVEAAADVTLGIRTLRLRRELQQSLASLGKALEGTVNALASVAEVRDPYTAGHQQRVTRLAVAIATEMGLPQEQIEGIHVAGSLHDVGKLYIPAEILSKPGKLNEVEFNLVKMHSQAGYDILKTVEFPWPVAQIVLQHHERLDGSGYPQGLRGEDMLLEAKILAVADVVEAMASHRPYRPSLGMGQALDEISQKSGVLYDPEVVDACFKLFYEKEFKLD